MGLSERTHQEASTASKRSKSLIYDRLRLYANVAEEPQATGTQCTILYSDSSLSTTLT